MPAYNFQPNIALRVVDGSKIHTVRPRRKRPTKVGDVLYLYLGMRTKHCQLLRRVECVDIKTIVIDPDTWAVVIDGKRLSWLEVVSFAQHDGFSTQTEFFDFFRRYPAEVLDNNLEVIYWRNP